MRGLKMLLKYETGFAVKNVRFITFITLLILSFTLFNTMYYNLSRQSQSYSKIPSMSQQSFEHIYRSYIAANYAKDHELAKSVLEADPFLIISFDFLMMLAPFMLIFILFPVISDEYQSGTMKCFVLYTGRTNFYFAKLASSLIVTLPVLALFIWISYGINGNLLIPVDFVDQFPRAVKYTILSALYLAAIASMVTMASTITKTVYGSLGLSISLYYVFFIIQYTKWGFLSPTWFRRWIYYNDPLKTAQYILIISAFTIFFNVVSVYALKKKEIS